MPTQTSAPHQRSRYRWNVPGGAYLVTTVTRGRQPVFADDANVRLLLDTIRQAKALYPFAMLGYVVMPDHLHLLIRLGEATRIDKLMQSIKWNYTRSHKLAHGLTSSQSLWQPGYWDRLIRADDDLDKCLAYVHFNPVKHGLCVDARTYRYSSLAEYLWRGWYGDVDWGAVQSPEMSVGEPE